MNTWKNADEDRRTESWIIANDEPDCLFWDHERSLPNTQYFFVDSWLSSAILKAPSSITILIQGVTVKADKAQKNLT